MPEVWEALKRELDQWADQGMVARFWVRDDDAYQLSPPLDRLHDLARRYDISIGLAVIPLLLQPELTDSIILNSQHFFPMCHGWQHKNYGTEQKPCEFGDARPYASLLGDAERAYHKFTQSFPEVNAVFVPPYACIARPLIKALPALGFAGVSNGPSLFEWRACQLAKKSWVPRIWGAPTGRLMKLNVQIDVIDWVRKTAQDKRLVARNLVAYLTLRRKGLLDRDYAIGLLTHHLAHDEKIWSLCESLLENLRRHSAVKFINLPLAANELKIANKRFSGGRGTQ